MPPSYAIDVGVADSNGIPNPRGPGSRNRTSMNEELALAIDELRLWRFGASGPYR